LAALLLTGCTLGPDFEPQHPALPGHWVEDRPGPVAADSHPVAAPLQPDWWTAFKDEGLTSLENRVAAANLDVRTATLRLAESRAQRRIAGAAAFPEVNGQGLYQHIKPSAKGIIGQLEQGGSAGPPLNNIPASDLYQYGFDASWELDLWGKVRRSLESADAEVDASADSRRGALLSVLSEVARDYMQLRGIQTQIRISQDNLAAAEDILALTRKRAAFGLAGQIDVANAGAQAATVAAGLPLLEQQQAQAINQLSFLLAQPPGALAAELEAPHPVPAPPDEVPVGLPSELAHRRPDIRQAEAELHAATAQIGVAKASFYPSITLSASFALQSTRFADLANWASRNETVGPYLSLPIFEGGKLTGNLHLTEARQQEAALSYQRTVLAAWQEVADALVAYQAEQRRRATLIVAVRENRRALALAREDYRHGTASFLQVLTAQQQLLQTEQQQADSMMTVSSNLVALCKALGGGWETTFPEQKE
jgi:NodT family efflux transporter outer membrane factor (OMF) lipoprotein